MVNTAAAYEVRYGAFTGRAGEAVTVSAGSDRDAVTQVASANVRRLASQGRRGQRSRSDDAEGITRWVTLDGTRRHFATKAAGR